MLAAYTFRVEHTNRRPIRTADDWSTVTVAEEDTPAGLRRAELLACQMAGTRCEMVTASRLLFAVL